MCWTEGFLVWNWGVCGTEGFLGLKKNGPFVLNRSVELRAVWYWGGPLKNEDFKNGVNYGYGNIIFMVNYIIYIRTRFLGSRLFWYFFESNFSAKPILCALFSLNFVIFVSFFLAVWEFRHHILWIVFPFEHLWPRRLPCSPSLLPQIPNRPRRLAISDFSFWFFYSSKLPKPSKIRVEIFFNLHAAIRSKLRTTHVVSA